MLNRTKPAARSAEIACAERWRLVSPSVPPPRGINGVWIPMCSTNTTSGRLEPIAALGPSRHHDVQWYQGRPSARICNPYLRRVIVECDVAMSLSRRSRAARDSASRRFIVPDRSQRGHILWAMRPIGCLTKLLLLIAVGLIFAWVLIVA